tara:strand:+ start:122 stop:1033 length:912 start_codon:yes stop_codon:yes gene_type:complete
MPKNKSNPRISPINSNEKKSSALRTSPLTISGMKRSKTNTNLLKLGWTEKNKSKPKSSLRTLQLPKGVKNVDDLFKPSYSSLKKSKPSSNTGLRLTIRKPLTPPMHIKEEEILGNSNLKNKLYKLPANIPFLLKLTPSKRLDYLHKDIPAVFQQQINKMYAFCRFKNNDKADVVMWGNKESLQRDMIVDAFLVLQNNLVTYISVPKNGKGPRIPKTTATFTIPNKVLFFENNTSIMYSQYNNIALKSVEYVDIEKDTNASLYNEILSTIQNMKKRGGKRKKTRKRKRRKSRRKRRKSRRKRKR